MAACSPPSDAPRPPPRQVSDMLESYEREIRSLEGSLLEAEENLDNTRWGFRVHQDLGLGAPAAFDRSQPTLSVPFDRGEPPPAQRSPRRRGPS